MTFLQNVDNILQLSIQFYQELKTPINAQLRNENQQGIYNETKICVLYLFRGMVVQTIQKNFLRFHQIRNPLKLSKTSYQDFLLRFLTYTKKSFTSTKESDVTKYGWTHETQITNCDAGKWGRVGCHEHEGTKDTYAYRIRVVLLRQEINFNCDYYMKRFSFSSVLISKLQKLISKASALNKPWTQIFLFLYSEARLLNVLDIHKNWVHEIIFRSQLIFHHLDFFQ